MTQGAPITKESEATVNLNEYFGQTRTTIKKQIDSYRVELNKRLFWRNIAYVIGALSVVGSVALLKLIAPVSDLIFAVWALFFGIPIFLLVLGASMTVFKLRGQIRNLEELRDKPNVLKQLVGNNEKFCLYLRTFEGIDQDVIAGLMRGHAMSLGPFKGPPRPWNEVRGIESALAEFLGSSLRVVALINYLDYDSTHFDRVLCDSKNWFEIFKFIAKRTHRIIVYVEGKIGDSLRRELVWIDQNDLSDRTLLIHEAIWEGPHSKAKWTIEAVPGPTLDKKLRSLKDFI